MLNLIYVFLSAFNWFAVCGIGWTWVLGADVSLWKMFVLSMFAGFFSLSNVLMMRALQTAMIEEATPKKQEPQP